MVGMLPRAHLAADAERTSIEDLGVVRWSGFSGQGPSLTCEAGTAPERGLPPMSKRRTLSPEFKAMAAMEAISGRKTLQEIAAVGTQRMIYAGH